MTSLTTAPTIFLGQAAHELATQFAADTTSMVRKRRIYLNTLAVYAVHHYCQCLRIETALEQGDSWQPGLRSLLDCSDLIFPGVGTIHCRPVLPDDARVSLMADADLGCIAVQLNKALSEGKLLGYSPPLVTEEVAIATLQPLDTFLECLSARSTPVTIHLGDWFQATFAAGWQRLETLLATEPNLELVATRDDHPPGTVVSGKWLTLNTGEAVLMRVAIAPDATHRTSLRVQLHPAKSQRYLPNGLELTLLSEAGDMVQTVHAREQDNYMQLRQFWVQSGELFRLRLTYQSQTLIELFSA